MTRINLVPPSELCDKHLLAEHRELTRIPNAVVRGKFSLTGQPTEYKLGEGHVKFFYDKLDFLRNRYAALTIECLARSFNVTNIWPLDAIHLPTVLWKDYIPTPEAIALSRERIAEKMPPNAKFTPHKDWSK